MRLVCPIARTPNQLWLRTGGEDAAPVARPLNFMGVGRDARKGRELGTEGKMDPKMTLAEAQAILAKVRETRRRAVQKRRARLVLARAVVASTLKK